MTEDCPCDKCAFGLVCGCAYSICGPTNNWAHFKEKKNESR